MPRAATWGRVLCPWERSREERLGWHHPNGEGVFPQTAEGLRKVTEQRPQGAFDLRVTPECRRPLTLQVSQVRVEGVGVLLTGKT